MAEFVEKRCEESIPEVEQMERIKLIDKDEARELVKTRRRHEYNLEKHTKCIKDYRNYINYEIVVWQLIKQRRYKLGITQKKSAIDYAITSKINRLYKQAINKFQNDFSIWCDYLKFCKEFGFKTSASRILPKMTQLHPKREECWHIAAKWEIKEAKNLESAKTYLFRGLQNIQDSPLLYLDLFKLELKDKALKIKTIDKKKEKLQASITESGETSSKFKRAEIIYEDALEKVKDISFFIELLNVTNDYENTESLQLKIIDGMIKKFENEPLVWDTIARRELQGLPYSFSSDTTMKHESTKQKFRKNLITSCNDVYLKAIEKLNSEEIWSLYIDCLLEINQEKDSLPNFKRNLLKSALSQGHQAKKLTEKYYLYWIGMLNADKKDEASQQKLAEVLCWATEALPNSEKLWYSRLKYFLTTNIEESVAKILEQATKSLGKKSVTLWEMKLQHVQKTNPEKTPHFFEKAIYSTYADVATKMKIKYLEWAEENKDIHETRKIYKNISVIPPFSVELHKRMIEIELMQPERLLKKVRDCFEIALLQFGGTDKDLWMDYLKFESDLGDPFQAPKIHYRAVNALVVPLADKFIAEYSLMYLQ